MKWFNRISGRRRWLIWLIVVVAVGVRLYRVTNPVADWHAFRQADTASVTREYVKHGVDLLRPRYQDLSNIQSGKDNVVGYRMVEFPLVNGLIASLVRAIPQLDLVVTSRIFSIMASVGTLVALYLFVKEVSDQRTAWVVAAVFALLPYSIYYGRAILPEPFMLLFSTWSLATFVLWLKRDAWQWYGLSVVTLALALLLKPFVLFLAPVYLVLGWQKWQWRVFIQPSLVVFAIASVVPLYAWREWIKQFPEGIPASDWLLNGNGIRLRPAWFRWLFWERLTKLFLGYAAIVMLPLNLFNRKKDIWVYGAWWVGALAYLVVVASGNVQHDYYQNLLLPIVAISVGRGALVMVNLLAQRTKVPLAVGGVTLVLLLGWYLAWQQVKGYFNVNHWEYVRAGEAADRLLPADAKVIAPAFGDTQFLFQTNRTGWPIGFEIEDKIQKGATHYITTSDDDEARRLEQSYHTIEKGPGYLLLDLQRKL